MVDFNTPEVTWTSPQAPSNWDNKPLEASYGWSIVCELSKEPIHLEQFETTPAGAEYGGPEKNETKENVFGV